MDINIFVIASKFLDSTKFGDNYHTIYVGSDEKLKKDNLSDETGDSIAHKNPFYCELTAQYWVWKNLKKDGIIGFCHYRRFFDTLDKSSSWIIRNCINYSEAEKYIKLDKIEEYLNDYDVILPAQFAYTETIGEQYIEKHREQDLDVIKDTIKTLYPEYEKSMNKVLSKNTMYSYNMYISKRKFFDEYMNWLFNILFTSEEYIDIPTEDAYQRRVFGFLAERLLNIYVEHNHLKVKEMPIIFVSDNPLNKQKNDLKFFLKKYFNKPIKVIKTLIGE